MGYPGFDRTLERKINSGYLEEAAELLRSALKTAEQIYGADSSTVAAKRIEVADRFALLAAIESGQLTPEHLSRVVSRVGPTE